MPLQLPTDPDMPLYQKIVHAVIHAVCEGVFDANEQLPTEASLASELGVHQLTVSRAYRELSQRGVVRQQRGSGTFIQADAPDRLRAANGRRFNTTALVFGQLSLEDCPRDKREIVTDIMLGVDDVLKDRAGRFLFVKSLNFACLGDLPDESLVLVNWCDEVDVSLIDRLRARNTLVLGVWMNQYEAMMPCVSFDPFQATGLACQHLVDRGYQHIGFIGEMSQSPPLAVRFFQYVSTLYSQGLDFKAQHARHVADNDLGAAFRVAYEMGQNGDLPEALFVDTDYKAMEAIRGLGMAGYRVPDDIAVVGYGGIPEAGTFTPGVTTVNLPRRQIGRRVAELVRDWPADGPPPASVTVDANLIIRRSCGASKVDRPATADVSQR